MKKQDIPHIFLVLCCLFWGGFSAFSQEEGGESAFQSLGVFHDTLWLGNSDNDSAPSPILSVWSVSAEFLISDRWYISPELGFYEVEYFYRDDIAFPAEIEYADAVRTFDILLCSPVLYRFAPAEDFFILAGSGPAFSFKIPRRTYGDGSSGDIGGYFMQKARFIHWEITAGLEWKFFTRLAFYARTRFIVPLYRLWDGDDMPFYDGLMAGAGFGLRLKL
jgi:hypothetical protein